MLLTEVFQGYVDPTITNPTPNPVLKIPLKYISVSPDIKKDLTRKEKKKYGYLLNQILKGASTTIPPIKVRRAGNGFMLVDGMARFFAFKKAGQYAIPAEVIPDNAVVENRNRFILYINGKPVAYYETQDEADRQASVITARSPNAKVEVKPGAVN